MSGMTRKCVTPVSDGLRQADTYAQSIRQGTDKAAAAVEPLRLTCVSSCAACAASLAVSSASFDASSSFLAASSCCLLHPLTLEHLHHRSLPAQSAALSPSETA
jgi:hypothetical protein